MQNFPLIRLLCLPLLPLLFEAPTACFQGGQRLGSLGGTVIKTHPPVREMWVWSLGWDYPMEEEMATHSSILAWRSPRTEEPGGYSPWGHKESDTIERLNTHIWARGYHPPWASPRRSQAPHTQPRLTLQGSMLARPSGEARALEKLQKSVPLCSRPGLGALCPQRLTGPQRPIQRLRSTAGLRLETE